MIFYLCGNRKIAFQYISVALVERKKRKEKTYIKVEEKLN